VFFGTVVIVAITKPFLVLKAVFPYLIVVGAFAGFVLWNGGVVLGISHTLFA
jgi:alpha-1,2-glucosyltransferase